MKKMFIALALFVCGAAHAEPVHRCSAPALKQAQRLLTFHFGADERIEIEQSVKVLSPIRNPANKSQMFDVLEVSGYVYKGQYRMHLIYAQTKGECLLMGQEILEQASL